MNPEEIKQSRVNQGKSAISNLRQDKRFAPPTFELPRFDKPPVPSVAPLPTVKTIGPMPKPNVVKYLRDIARPVTRAVSTIATTALPQLQGPGIERVKTIAREIAPKITNIKKIENKYNPLNPESVTNKAIKLVARGAEPKKVVTAVAKEAIPDLNKYVSEYVSGTLTALDAPNRILIRPAWDALKTKIAKDRGKTVAESEILAGRQTISLPEILDIDPNSLDYQAYRFLDFAPELISIPGSQTGKLQTLAKEIKVQPGLFDDIAEDAAQKFTQETGEALSKEVVNRAKQIAKDAGNVKNITKAPEQNLIQEARKYKTLDDFIKNIGVQRFEEPNVEVSFNKPQGLYTTPANFKSPFASLGGKQSFFAIKPNAKIVEVDTTGFAPDPLKRGVDQMATNLVWLRNTYPDIANNIRGKRFNELKEMFKKDFPKTNWDLFTESQDMIEGYAGLLAKRDGIDVIKGVDNNFPQFSEVVIFNKDVVLDENQLRNIFNSSRKSAEDLISPVAKREEITPAQQVTGDFGGAVPPSGGIPTFLPEPPKIVPTKERKFPVSVKKAESTAPGVKKILDNRLDLYSPIKNKDEFAKATKYVQETPIDEVVDALKLTDDPRQVSYVGQALMQKLQKEGNYARVVDILDIVAEEATRAGQAIQALSIWNKLTPEGALRYAQTQVTKYNQANKLLPGQKGYLQLTDGQIKNITDQAKKIGGDMSDDMLETAKLVNEIAKVIPATIGEKLSAFQTLAQLLNPKTFIRNIGGNLIFGSIDTVTQSFASLIDLATALFTKKRTVAPPNLKRLYEGGVEGAKAGLRDALTGADTSGGLRSQFDLRNASVFNSKVMQGLEKALNVVLKAPDRAFYEATYKDTLQGLMNLAKTDTPTKEMLEIAHNEGLRRTFQDPSRAAKAFQEIKNALNRAGIKGFGLGDLILKYPFTPGNLLTRAIEYSPASFLTTTYELARPLMGQPFRQREFANNLSRALVGTGIIQTGANLYNLGILTARPNSDRDARAAQDLQGIKSYSFNVSSLKRFVLSGFDPEAAKPEVGDILYSYDWAQPISVPLAMGANIAENEGKIKTGSFQDKLMLSFGPFASEIIASSETLVEQPLLTGLQRLFNSNNPTQGIIDTIAGLPASFMPTILNQVNQLTDNVSRETYDPNILKAGVLQAQARIPYLATFLPERKDILGRTRTKYPDNSNTLFNVFINPGFVDTIKDNPSLKEVIQIFEETGETTQIPRIVQKNVKVNGETRLLTGEEIGLYQEQVGTMSDQAIRTALTNPEYTKLSATDRSKLIASMLTDANKIAKIRLFGENPDISKTQELLQNGDIDNYVLDKVINKQESLLKQQLKTKGISNLPKLKSLKVKRPKGTKARVRKAPRAPKIKIAKIKKRKPIQIKGVRRKRVTRT